MLPDKEIWTAASMLMQRYGDIAAEEHAFNRGQELRNAGDMEGHRVWQAILGRIIRSIWGGRRRGGSEG